MIETSYLRIIQNGALLLAMTLLFNLIPDRRRTSQRMFWQLLIGLLLGGMGIIVMLTSWVMGPGIIFDTRSVLLGIAGLFLGAIPTLVAMGILAAFRLLQGGAGAPMGISVILVTGAIGIFWRRWLHKPLKALTWRELYLFGWVIHIAMLLCAFTLPLPTALPLLSTITLPVLLIYPLGTMALGLMMVDYLRRESNANELQRSEARLRSLVEILEKPIESVQKFLDSALDQALRLTESKIGYIYFYSEERKEFVLNTWSKGVMDECEVRDPQTCSELEKTGIWGEAVRQRKAIVLNDFQVAHPLKKGVPAGHVKLLKFMTLPIFNAEHIVAVVGVANKESNYNEADVLQLTLLMNEVWKAIQQKKAVEALRKSEEQKNAIIDNLPSALIHILDREFRYVSNFGEGLREAHLTNEMLVGKTIFEVLGPELGEIVSGHYRQVLAGKTVQFEVNFGGQDYLAHAAPLRDEQGNIIQIIVLSLNITENKQSAKKLQTANIDLQQLFEESDQLRRALLSVVEDQNLAQEKVQQLNRELEQRVQDRTAQLAAANQELEAFSYSVSHDLRAPLRALDGFSGHLLANYSKNADEQGQHYLARIQEASRQMGQLIEDLLNLSRISRQEMKRRGADLSMIARQIAENLTRQDPQRQVEFDIAPELLVQADPNLMKIALENLLNNAYKFTSQCAQAQITFGVDEQDGHKVYFVRDNGAGFDMAYADKLFTPFQRLHSNNEFPGTGIGLATVKRIITRHGGEIWPESKLKIGTTFYFTLDGGER
jgi:signal transduction histidine kinase